MPDQYRTQMPLRTARRSDDRVPALKVLHVVPSLANQWGGPVTVLRGLVTAMRRLGVHSSVIAVTGGRAGAGTELDGARTDFVHASPLAKVWTAYSAELRLVLPRLIEDSDIVHIHELWHYPHWAAHRLALAYDIPYVVTPHGELDPWRLRQKAWKKAPYLALFQRRVLRRASAIHAITETEVGEILSQVPTGRVQVIPNGVDADAFGNLPSATAADERYPQLAGKRVILFLGRLHKVKGLDLLARAFVEIVAHRQDVMLVAAGPDEGYQREVERILTAAGLSQRAVFTGLVSGREKLELLARANVFTLLSYGEGFSTTVLEAMVCGLPVVISKQCKFLEVAEARAGIVVDTESREVVKALEYLLDHPDEAQAMGRRATGLVRQKYSWDTVAEQMLDLYRGAVLAAQERHGSVPADR